MPLEERKKQSVIKKQNVIRSIYNIYIRRNVNTRSHLPSDSTEIPKFANSFFFFRIFNKNFENCTNSKSTLNNFFRSFGSIFFPFTQWETIIIASTLKKRKGKKKILFVRQTIKIKFAFAERNVFPFSSIVNVIFKRILFRSNRRIDNFPVSRN